MGLALATAAGLNGYLPLLIVALADRAAESFNLDQPYDFISSSAGIVILLLLLTVELVADKIPRIDHLNDLVQSAIRPAAGAVLFMAVAHPDDPVHPLVAMLLGLVVAGAVHWYKTTSRPLITVNTGGVGNPIVSLVEDALCAAVTVVSLILPLVGVAFAALSLICMRSVYRRFQRPRVPPAPSAAPAT
jgi:hypothetical protein